MARFIIMKKTSVIKSIVYAALSLALDYKNKTNRRLQIKPGPWVSYQGLLKNIFNIPLSDIIKVVDSAQHYGKT